MPFYKQSIKPSCFHTWRSYFIQQKSNALLNLTSALLPTTAYAVTKHIRAIRGNMFHRR